MHLTLEAVKKAALEYYTYGGLAAQAPSPSDRACRYGTRDTAPCAVGAAIPFPLREECDRNFGGLVSEKPFELNDGSLLTWEEGVPELQSLHDEWCSSACEQGQGHYDNQETINRERKFLALLYS